MRHHIPAAILQFHIFDLLFRFELFGFGRCQAPLLFFSRLPGTELVLHRHQVDAVALALLFLPAGATHAQFLEDAAVELFELVFGPLVNNDSIRTAADDLLHRHFPGAEHALPQQRHPQSTHHQRRQFSRFDVEGESEHPPELTTGFGDHLAVDHPAVAIGVEALAQ